MVFLISETDPQSAKEETKPCSTTIPLPLWLSNPFSLRLTPLCFLRPTLCNPLQNVVPILIPFQLGDLDFTWMNAQRHRLPI